MQFFKKMSEWVKDRLRNWLLENSNEEPNITVDCQDCEQDTCENCDYKDIEQDVELTPEQIELMQKFIGSIQFVVLNDGKILISCNFLDDSIVVAETYGGFLYALNNGLMSKNILDYLIDFGGQDIQLAKFVTKIMENWRKTEESIKSKPVICPTQTFKLNRAQELEEE